MTKKEELIKTLVEMLSLLVDEDDYTAEYVVNKYMVNMVFDDWKE
jgi:hypothetical protein